MTEEDFWTWFETNKTTIENLFDGKNEDHEIYKTPSENLNHYSEFLIPEITKKENNQLVLVISCDGVKKGIPFVESLTNNIRQFDNWRVQKYRNPDPVDLIPINGLSIKRNKIFITWNELPLKKYHVIFHTKVYSLKDIRYKAGTVLHLQNTIGELNSMTRIESVEFKNLPIFQSTKSLKTLDDLKIEIDKNFA